MKALIYSFFSVILTSLPVMAQDSKMIRDALAKTERSIPENYRDPLSVVEKRLSSWEKVEAFTEIQSALENSWRTNLPKINEFATNDTQKALFFKAAQILPRKEYIEFMIAASDQVASEAVSKQQFKWALFPGQKHLREMWTEAPPSESLKQLARKAKMIFSEDTSQANFFDHVLSGKVAADNRKPEQTSSSDSASKSLQSWTDHPPAPSVQPPIAPTTSNTKTTPQPKPSESPIEEPTASKPWSFIVVLIVAASGLLWLLLKGRK